MFNIQAQRLKKVWKSGDGLKLSFSYDFAAGKGYQIVGANGCGKTTLLKILCGLLLPDQGKVEAHVDVGWCGSYGCGATPRLTGLDNINLMEKFLNLDHEDKMLERWKNLEGFTDALETDFGHCSHGMQMMVSLYLSQLKGNHVIIWDEPFAHLSFKNTTYLLTNWQELTGAQTLIFTSHEELPHFSGEVLHL